MRDIILILSSKWQAPRCACPRPAARASRGDAGGHRAVHGDEYEGVRTLLELSRELDPARMSGDAIFVPVINPPAFWNGTRTSPLDGQNLARVFPGRPDGTPSESIAYWIDQAVFPHADLFIDLHSAGIESPSHAGRLL